MHEENSEFLYHEECEGCGSSDAKAVYDNGTSFCFSCQAWTKDEELKEEEDMFEKVEVVDLSWIQNLRAGGLKDRKIKKDAANHFNLRIKEEDDGYATHHYYPYTKDGKLVAYKERTVEGKKFNAIGDMKGVELFGQSAIDKGNRKKLVITEGEIDAMAVAQSMLDDSGRIYPVVSLPNGAQSAHKALLANRDWVREFNEVILMFDQDTPGQEAIEIAAKVIGGDKVKIAKLPAKDPSEVYLKHGIEPIISQLWNAKPWCPPGVINGETTWETYIQEKDAVYVPYPDFTPGLNEKIFGRRLGSITMFTSGTGSGKTSFLREDALHLFKTTEDMIGICSLEESVAETVRGFIALELNKRVGLPGVDVEEHEEKNAWKRTMGTSKFMLLDHQGSIGDDSLLDKIEFMAISGCKFIYLDHITIAISGSSNVNQAIDDLMSDLLKVCKRHDVWIGVVSHLRKSGNDKKSYEEGGSISMDDLKGSGSLKQISAQIISLERDKSAEDITQRHLVKVRVLKDRFGGDTGWAGEIKFNHLTGRLEGVESTTKTGGFEAIPEKK